MPGPEVGANRMMLVTSERRLLAALIQYKPNYVPHSVLATYIWGEDGPNHSVEALRMIVNRIRKKIGSASLRNLPGGGWCVTDLLPEWAFELAIAEMALIKIAVGENVEIAQPRQLFHEGKRPRPTPDVLPAGEGRKSLQKRWTCLKEGCACTCHKISAALAKKAEERGHWRGPLSTEWTKEQDEFIRATWQKTRWVPTVMTQFELAFKRSLTQKALYHRMVHLGISRREGLYTINDVAKMLGMGYRKVHMLVLEEKLPARRHWGGTWWVMTMADLEAFMCSGHAVVMQSGQIRHEGLRLLYLTHHGRKTGAPPEARSRHTASR